MSYLREALEEEATDNVALSFPDNNTRLHLPNCPNVVFLLLLLLCISFSSLISLSGQVEEARLRNQLQKARTTKKVPGLAGITELNTAGKLSSSVNKHGYLQDFIAWSEADP